MDLIKYRDAGMHTYTYFWTVDNRVVSPYLDTEKEAFDWLESLTDGGDQVSTGQRVTEWTAR
jgi:hypothetical protein